MGAEATLGRGQLTAFTFFSNSEDDTPVSLINGFSVLLPHPPSPLLPDNLYMAASF